MNRLPHLPSFKINPGRYLTFTYGGRILRGCDGDSIATALFANGVHIFSRSLKYHRPRGLYSLDGETSNGLMEVDGLANVRAETTALRNGMRVVPQNVWGSPELDALGFLDKLGWAMPAGFYYRVFHKPYRWWPFFQDRIRKMSGIGKLNRDWRPGVGEEIFLHAELCVIGAGPAGLTAALAAADHGLRVVLLEARAWPGGFYDWRERSDATGIPLRKRAEQLAAAVLHRQNIRTFTRACATGIWGDNLVTGIQTGGPADLYAERYLQVRARNVVVATGCLERPAIFENNERPGVMQSSCAHRLARWYGILPGRRAVFAVADDLALEAALDLVDLGLEVAAIADARSDGHDPELTAAISRRRIPFLSGWTAGEARGPRHVRGVELRALNSCATKHFSCDLLVASSGLTSNAALLFVADTKMAYDRLTNFFLPKQLPPRLHAAGRLLALTDLEAIEASGRIAALRAAFECGAATENDLIAAEEQLAELPGPVRSSKLITAPGIGKGKKSFICFDEDVTVKNIQQSCAAGFDVPELAKRFSAAGTGPSQGAIAGHNLPLLMAEMRTEALPEILPTTVRPPVVPTLFATLAGPAADIHKRTPLDRVQGEAGAVFRKIGAWRRARYFDPNLNPEAEVQAVRHAVGIIDVSTLGKFRVFGPDALKVLDRVYVGDMSMVPRGKVKYSAMVNEDGCLIDDGVITRLADHDYYLTTSTGRADMTAEWLRYHSRYEDWDFHILNLTDALAAINIAGPKARAVLARLTDADLGADALPFMGYRECKLSGSIPVRIMRLGFVGELSFELHLPASYAETVWIQLLAAGREFGIRPFGLEAQNILRLEKGHVIIGQESEIRTTLHDLGLGWLWDRRKVDANTVGGPSLALTENQPGRLKLVGLRMDHPEEIPADGSLVVDDAIRGHICTARYSVSLGQAIALALVEEALNAPGTRLRIFQADMGDRRFEATVVATPFYDPEGLRLRM